MFSFGLYLVVSNNWFVWPLETLWKAYPFTELTLAVKCYMILQVGFYLQAITVICLEDKRKDFWAMMIHHLITAYLIAAALLWNYTFYGIIIVMLHDFADIFLYLTKVIHYAKSKWQDLFFAIFALSFLVSRLMIFPAVAWSYWKLSPLYMPLGIDESRGYYAHETVRLSTPLFGCLLTLHTFWFYLIVNMIIKALKEGDLGEDIRSDSE
eukprot:TRINITY_DN654_c0_g2_i1.p4 TRINITY_DN654_c0_g2~~TRINITY_DN654_c0_g2_i1.p4  ORF type:complete len:210 (-),score=53.91 TRINITY_DN654_c0_g2_i1:57-686(-)